MGLCKQEGLPYILYQGGGVSKDSDEKPCKKKFWNEVTRINLGLIMTAGVILLAAMPRCVLHLLVLKINH